MIIFKRSHFIAWLAVALILIALTACQSSPTPTPTIVIAPPTRTASTSSSMASLAIPTPTVTPIIIPDLKGRALKVGSDTSYPPFESINDKKEVVGFDVDLVNEICKRLNCKATFVSADFDTLLNAVSNQIFDLSASGWTITDERAKKVDFGLPYIQNTQMLLVRSDETRIKEPEDLKTAPYIVAVQFGTTSAATMKKFVADPAKQVKEYPDIVAAVQALLNKQADVVVVYTFAAFDLIDQNKGKVKVTGKQFGDDYLGIVFRKGDAELKTAFDAGLKIVYQDGTWSKLCDKWWKDTLPKPDCSGKNLPLAK